AMLEKELGDRSRHPSLLRLCSARTRAASGTTTHPGAVDPAVRGALAEGPAPAAGWHARAERSRYAAGLIDLTVASQSLLALRVRHVDAERISAPSVRTILR